MHALWMLLASLLFATMGVCIKFAADHFNAAEIVFWRGVVGVAFMVVFARARGISLRTSYPGMHLWRSVIGVASLSAWFYAIAHLPLATAMTLNYMSSVWIAAFLVGGMLITWTPAKGSPFAQGPLVLTVLLGFVGVVLMLRPTVEQNQMFAALIGLLSGIGSAFAYMQVMALARAGEPEVRTVAYFAVGTVVAGLAGMAATSISPWSWQYAGWLLAIGLLAAVAQLCMTRAYSLVLFGDRLPLSGWLGMGMIVVSGIAATILRARAAPNAPAEEHS